MKYVGENKNNHIANKGDILYSTNNLAGVTNPKQGVIYYLRTDNVGHPKGYYKWTGTSFVPFESDRITVEVVSAGKPNLFKLLFPDDTGPIPVVIDPDFPDNYELVFA